MTRIFNQFNLRTKLCAISLMILPLVLLLFLVPEVSGLQNSIVLGYTIYVYSNIALMWFKETSKIKIYTDCFPSSNGKKYILPAQYELIDNTYDLIRDKRKRAVYIEKIAKKLELNYNRDENLDRLKLDYDDACKAIDWLINNTRNESNFPLLNEYNMYFHLMTNFKVLKNKGIIISIICITIKILCLHYMYNGIYNISDIINNAITYFIIIDIIVLLTWILFITNKRLQKYGKEYAKELLKACDTLL